MSAAMQTERVTFLTSRDHKAALDAYAKGTGMSVGRVVREATSLYLAEGPLDEEDKLAILVAELNETLPIIEASFDRMSAMVKDAQDELARLREERKHLS
jgi:hypothetical protein